ncbi:xanthine dehydrogenase accessory protein XdhC [Rhizobium sp. SL42]|uniref:xanthine dehydrogenase accessory protein XdhC n=1 Tax=Rhizobium sp. SL42 TaxID=2806346 RepID=UPI001F00A339|nr:xanthine dehydrogenase accessory protein XdhC [Rhizobium sp. SL42]UJW74390.1 xanthine dehydrogenase accessory protein XdhC [Rhizobium sp. SL42]
MSVDHFLSTHPALVLVKVTDAKGSTPRETGAFMLVAPVTVYATIGGGHMEFLAIEKARAMLAADEASATLDIPLGPEIGQCCGGRVVLTLTNLDAQARADLLAREEAARERRPEIHIYGAGHVGLALAAALAPLPFNVTLIDTRADIDGHVPEGIVFRRVAMPEAEIARLPEGGAAVILTHDHALDFLIARQALARPDLRYVGMIGSATKRATFSRWLIREHADAADLERLVLPIGGSAVKDKRPPVIAAMVAAELLATLLG